MKGWKLLLWVAALLIGAVVVGYFVYTGFQV